MRVGSGTKGEGTDPNSGYDSDAPISSWACKRPIQHVHGNVYNAPVTIHVHHAPLTKKPRSSNQHDPDTAAYLRAISGTIPKRM